MLTHAHVIVMQHACPGAGPGPSTDPGFNHDCHSGNALLTLYTASEKVWLIMCTTPFKLTKLTRPETGQCLLMGFIDYQSSPSAGTDQLASSAGMTIFDRRPSSVQAFPLHKSPLHKCPPHKCKDDCKYGLSKSCSSHRSAN